MIFGKKHFVAAALILALGAAIYLNWQFAPTDTLIADDTAQGAVQTEYVSAVTQPSATDASFSEAAVEVGKKTNYFDQARSDRESSRKEALETLNEIIENVSLSSAEKTQAVSSASKIAENMDKESAIESLIKSKGFADCVVIISDNQVNVIIPAKENGITPADAAIVKDAVIGQIDISPSCIKIIEAK